MLAPETVLQNRYKLQRQLNDNPARQTWLAEDVEKGDRVALKLLALGGAVRWQELKLFEREAQVLQHLEHPCIPKYRDYFALDEQTLWFGLVQDYIPGKTLKQLLQEKQTLSPQQIYKVAEEVLGILDFLHNLVPPLLHRDIKPSNLIWGEDDRVYLIDFGSVQARPPGEGASFTVVGTYGYTPMEQYGGQAVPASDLYALGATLIHLLTGVSPSELPQGEDFQLQFRDRLPGGIDPHLASWLAKLVHPSVKQRFSNAKEAGEELRNRKIPIPPAQMTARVYRSPQQLQIVIPSRFEREVLQIASKGLSRLGKKVKKLGARFVRYFQSLKKQTRQSILSGVAIAVGGILLLDVFTSLSIVEGAFYVTLTLITVPLGVFASLFPLAFLIWAIASHSDRSDYFQTTRISFNPHRFEIKRSPAQRQRREGGKMEEIEAVEMTNFVNASGQLRHSLVLSTSTEGRILFLPSTRAKNYLFGQQLSPLELRQLQREIQDWLEHQRQGKLP